jgi:Fur family transcriptional regulator, ferric uptake regulator
VHMSDGCDFRQIMAHAGVRCTALRIGVLEALGEFARAMTALEILESLRASRRVNKVTVYRILDEFLQKGIVRRLSMEGGASCYELACEHNPPHPHFHCRNCGEIQCLDPVPMERVWGTLKGPVGNWADRIEIRVGGVCHKCRGA